MNAPLPQASDETPGAATVKMLLDRYERSIRQYIARRSGPYVLKVVTVEDLYQDAVAAAVAGARNYVHYNDRGFLGWIYTIARRVICNMRDDHHGQLQSHRIKGAHSSGAGVAEGDLRADIRTPSSFVAGDEHAGMLRAALQTLPELQREVLSLYKLRQLPLAEVARRVGRSEGQVCRIAQQAIRSLRLALNRS